MGGVNQLNADLDGAQEDLARLRGIVWLSEKSGPTEPQRTEVHAIHDEVRTESARASIARAGHANHSFEHRPPLRSPASSSSWLGAIP